MISRHHHRRLRADAVGPDRGRVLEQRPPRAAARGRAQLRPGRASSCGRTSRSCRASPTPSCRRYPNAGPAQRLRRLRRAAAGDRRASSRSWSRTAPSTSSAAAAARRPTTSRPSRTRCRDEPPAPVPTIERRTRLSGLEPLDIGPDSLFVNVGERTNVTGSRRFAKLILDGRYAEAVEVARQQVENGAQMHRHQHGRGAARLRGGDDAGSSTCSPRSRTSAACRSMIDSSKWSVIEAGLQHVQGRVGRQLASASRRGRRSSCARRRSRAGTARRSSSWPSTSTARRRRSSGKLAIAHRALPAADRAGRLRPRGRHPRPQHLRHRHRHRGARAATRVAYIEATRRDQGGAARGRS